MKTSKNILISLTGLIAGYLLIPLAGLGFLLSTNSSKGWDVTDDDGIMFIPFGIILLLCTMAMLAYYLLGFRKKQNMELNVYIKNRIPNISFVFGIVAYLITAWCF